MRTIGQFALFGILAVLGGLLAMVLLTITRLQDGVLFDVAGIAYMAGHCSIVFAIVLRHLPRREPWT
jgi:hypothetical protein